MRSFASQPQRDLKYSDNLPSDWTLDQATGPARLAKPSEHLKNYVVALKPMLGCIGVAPSGLLIRVVEHVAVMELDRVDWSDWGRSERIAETRQNFCISMGLSKPEIRQQSS